MTHRPDIQYLVAPHLALASPAWREVWVFQELLQNLSLQERQKGLARDRPEKGSARKVAVALGGPMFMFNWALGPSLLS